MCRHDHITSTVEADDCLLLCKAVIDDAKADPGWPNAHPVTRGGENTYLQMFLAVAKIAARHGLMVMMACHRLDKDSWPGTCRCRCMPRGDHMVVL